MWTRPESDQFVDELYLAGERAPQGVYKQLGSDRKIVLENEDALPASMDGRVACYVRMEHTWDPPQASEGGKFQAFAAISA